MASKTEMVLATALIVTVIVAVTVVLTMNRAVGNVGKIRAVGFDVYADKACTAPLTQIDWGTLSPGEMAVFTMYARNSGNVNITLSFNTTDWSPSNASTYLLVAWNYSGQAVKPLEVVAVSTTLTVSPSIQGVTNFSYTMNIQATEVK
jgi:hypothetical protein